MAWFTHRSYRLSDENFWSSYWHWVWVDEVGNYLEPKNRTFDRVDVILPQMGAIYQVCQRDGESMDSFLTRVANKYNKIEKGMPND